MRLPDEWLLSRLETILSNLNTQARSGLLGFDGATLNTWDESLDGLLWHHTMYMTIETMLPREMDMKVDAE